MRKLLLSLTLIFGFSLAFAQGPFNFRIQLIHNSPDPALDTVDVYFEPNISQGTNIPVITGFVYGTVDGLGDRSVPGAGTFSSILGTAKLVRPGGNPATAADVLFSTGLTLTQNDTFVIAVSGLLPTPTLNVFSINEFQPAGTAEIRVLHGVHDAPAVDVRDTNGNNIITNLAYGQVSTPLVVPVGGTTQDTLEVYVAGTSTLVGRYGVNASALSGFSGIIFARGYLNPQARPSARGIYRPSFNLWAVRSDETTVQGVSLNTARVQVIHNSADAAAATVDIYSAALDLELDNVAFRTATGFTNITLPTALASNIDIGVAGPTSSSIGDTLAARWVSIAAGDTLFLIANGLLANTGVTAFNIWKVDAINEFQASVPLNGTPVPTTSVRLFHGVDDAPALDLLQNTVAARIWPPTPVAVNWAYGASSGYVPIRHPLAAGAFVDVLLSNNSDSVLRTYRAAVELPALNLANKRVLAVASGRLATDFSVYVVPPAGGAFVELPQFGYLHAIHNSGVAAANVVDVQLRVNGNVIANLDSVAYRQSSAFRPVPANTPIEIEVFAFASGATNVGASIINLGSQTIGSGRSVVALVDGVTGTGYAANPDPNVTNSLGATVINHAPQYTRTGDVKLLVVHGSSDAPAVDVRTGGNVLVAGPRFRQSAVRQVPIGTYTLDVTPAGVPGTVVRSSVANLQTLPTGISTGVVYASGFLNPANNSNGAELDLVLALPNGTNIVLPRAASGIESGFDGNFSVYPNPVSTQAILAYAIDRPMNLTATLTDVTGRVITVLDQGLKTAGNHEVTFSSSALTAGVYFIRLEGDGLRRVGKIMVD